MLTLWNEKTPSQVNHNVAGDRLESMVLLHVNEDSKEILTANDVVRNISLAPESVIQCIITSDTKNSRKAGETRSLIFINDENETKGIYRVDIIYVNVGYTPIWQNIVPTYVASRIGVYHTVMKLGADVVCRGAEALRKLEEKFVRENKSESAAEHVVRVLAIAKESLLIRDMFGLSETLRNRIDTLFKRRQADFVEMGQEKEHANWRAKVNM
jgi:hypothetical protein